MPHSTINGSDPIAPPSAGADGGAGASKLVQLEGKKRPVGRAASFFLIFVICAICGLQFAYRSSARQSQLDESQRATVTVSYTHLTLPTSDLV